MSNFWGALQTSGLLSPCKGPLLASPRGGIEIYHRITITGRPLLAASFYCLLPLFTRERVSELFHAHLVHVIVFVQLIADIFRYDLFVLAHCVHVVSSTPETSAPIFVLQICVPVEDHQRALRLERPYKLCYTHSFRSITPMSFLN